LDRIYLTFVEAAILIFKHATLLRASKITPTAALTQVELAYREANVDLKVQQLLAASSQEQHSVQLFADFIMATDIGSFVPSYVEIISH
jgi:hypothetical protein